jgi:hypothetical protein
VLESPEIIQALTFLAMAQLTLSAVLAWLFVALYSRVRWWATKEGRHLMKFTIAFALVLSLSLLNQVVHLKLVTLLVLSIALFGWISWELAMRSWLHLQAVRESKEAEKRALATRR